MHQTTKNRGLPFPPRECESCRVTDGVCARQHRFTEMCKDMWFGRGCHDRCISIVEQFEKIQDHYRCGEFWEF